MMIKFCVALLLTIAIPCLAQNPVVPGYFADPNIREFDGTYYLYGTTDGYTSVSGEPMVWISTDLVTWKPKSLGVNHMRFFWAPSVIKGKNGKYYMYYTHGMDYTAYVWVGDTPVGPWKEMGQIGGFDFETFEDPVSGKIYGLSSSKEVFEFDNNPASPTYLIKVEKKHPFQGKFFDFTEGPYIISRNNLYYLMWAGGRCWQESYKIQYATSKSLLGPYTDGENNPLLETNKEKEIYGPGHHSILKHGDKYLVFYHRQDKNRYPTCNYRFLCVGELTFGEKGTMEKIRPIDNLRLELKLPASPLVNLSLNRPVATDSETKGFPASFALDDQNDTRWKAEAGENKWLSVDLGSQKKIEQIEIAFEYPDKFTLFKVEYSNDNANWTTYVDHTKIAKKGYESYLTQKSAEARYVRLTILRTEEPNASIWELKVWGK
ncbi:MAG: family 43 glycosylhydrolase [Bacteroidota bacterium]